MLFNSYEFLIFLPIVFLLYWYVVEKDLTLQNLLIIVASYVFYGWWDYRFLSLIILSSALDFTIGIKMGSTNDKRTRKLLLWASLIFNLGLLGVFKYYNFFLGSFVEMFGKMGVNLEMSTLKIILPVGISFYTFQTLSYTIDIYRKKLEPTKDPFAFFAFVCFFPQLVAGPIERASNLLPQFMKKRKFDVTQSKDGLRQILWGLFKKVVIADNCALVVNDIFANYESMPASALVLGAVLFAFQIYGDFSGYSDIAIGTARLFGFNLMRNFAYPYFSRDIAEFWRRWHISLSTWFRDYLYIPLGGSRVDTKFLLVRNVMAIFIVSGFWHGANWTFMIWGLLNGLYFLPSILMGKNRKNLGIVAENSWLPGPRDIFNMGMTFALTCLAWIFFRAETVTDAFAYIIHMADSSILSFSGIKKGADILPWIFILVVIEWIQRRKEHGLDIAGIPVYARWLMYYVMIFCILYMRPAEVIDFIYFQF